MSVRKIRMVIALWLVTMLLMPMTQAIAQQTFRVRVNRWLEVRQLVGPVEIYQGNRAQAARIGDRLQAIGDGINTGARAAARLAVDTEVGFVTVTENTTLRIQGLQVAPDNGRITRIVVTRGQVRVQVRPFNHRGSKLEILTPAGVSGVRGTEFGIAVQPGGKTGLATLKGGVISSAQGQSQLVQAGFQNFTQVGEPPSVPVPLRNDTSLNYRFEVVMQRGIRRLKLTGLVDPVNTIYVDGYPQATDRTGQFTILRSMPSYPRYQILVVTPLGKQQNHEVAFN